MSTWNCGTAGLFVFFTQIVVHLYHNFSGDNAMTKRPTTDFAIYTERLDVRLRESTRLQLEAIKTYSKKPLSYIARDVMEKAVARRYNRLIKLNKIPKPD